MQEIKAWKGQAKERQLAFFGESTSYRGRFVVAIYPMERGFKSVQAHCDQDPPFHPPSRSRRARIGPRLPGMEPDFGAVFGYIGGVRSQGYVKVVEIAQE